MSFTVRCPFCKTEMECPDEALGQVGICPSCNREIDLDDDRTVPPSDPGDPAAREIRNIRAAAIAAAPSVMPRVTWAWAFDFIFKLSVAAAVIDGIVAAGIWILFSLGRMLGNR